VIVEAGDATPWGRYLSAQPADLETVDALKEKT